MSRTHKRLIAFEIHQIKGDISCIFYHISGEFVALESGVAVIDCNGVGYALTVSHNTQQKLHTPGKKIKLYTHFCVREDDVELFGFYTLEERDTFRLLITVSGVGPKAAINILSVLSPESLAAAIMNEDVKSISKAQNVGQKTAARIVLELKDKISKNIDTKDVSNSVFDAFTTPIRSNKLSEAQNALMVLGYKQSEAQNALKGIDVDKYTLEDIIREALKKLI